MVGMLHAIPKTPLHARLAAEGRLDLSDEPEFGTNVIPLHLEREELRDGYVGVLKDLYEPAAYFDRIEELYLKERIPYASGRARYWRRHLWPRLKTQTVNLVRAAGLFVRLMWNVSDPALRREYRRRLWRFIKVRRDPGLLVIFLFKCALHYHHYTMAHQMASGEARLVNSF